MGDVISESRKYLDVYCNEPLVLENGFRAQEPDRAFPPSFLEVRHLLPEPFFDNAGEGAATGEATPSALAAATIAAYWKCWEIGFKNLRRVHSANGFISPFIDSAFNDCLFLWDSVFVLMWTRFGRRAFNFQGTLNNLYKKQHPDGFICREIHEWDGQDQFHRADLPSTGPNLLAWSEWESYCLTGDKERLRRVFPPLAAYHRWMSKHRTYPDGSYFACGLASGMDNQPRVSSGSSAWCDHDNLAWLDACAQALLSAKILVAIARELGDSSSSRTQLMAELKDEARLLSDFINSHMWHAGKRFYFDRRLRGAGVGDAALSDVKSVGAFWLLLAGAVPPERLDSFVAHLDDPREFNRPTRVPSLSADSPQYSKDGGYWLGASWPSTTYAVLRGLTAVGKDDVAADIGANYVAQNARCFMEHGTVFENLSPEKAAPGVPAKGDFCGWGGIGPVAVLLEYVFGLRCDVPTSTLVWDVRLLDGFGVRRFPFGKEGLVDLRVLPRRTLAEAPLVVVSSTVRLRLVLQWGRGAETRGGMVVDRAAAPPLQQRVLELAAGGNIDLSVASAAVPPPTAASAPAAVAPRQADVGAVRRLVEMGFEASLAWNALLECGGNEEAAVTKLLSLLG